MAAAVAASQRAPGRLRPAGHHGQDPGEDRRRAYGDDRPDGDAGAGGGGEEGRLVRGGSRRADGEQAPGARPAGYQAAQRAASQRHEKKQKMAPACKGWPTGWPRSAALCASAPSPDTAPP
jgi:hypothetical protein